MKSVANKLEERANYYRSQADGLQLHGRLGDDSPDVIIAKAKAEAFTEAAEIARS